MMLYVMRHGPAEDHSTTGRDEDRALTESGKDRVRDAVRLLVKEGEMPRRILASRLARAAQTAEIVAAAARATGWSGSIETVRELAPAGKTSDLIHRLEQDGADAPMIVGHEPDLSSLVERLLGDPMSEPMDKAMIVALEIDTSHIAHLRFILDPRSLVLLHDNRQTSAT
jgi:phosphohistidine phosphatase